MAATSPLKRLSRPANPPPFRLTARDVAILSAVARFRFLSAPQIVRLIGGSEHALAVRLKHLFYHRLLDRPRHQHANLVFFFDEGNHPLVYGLGTKGAAVLFERGMAIDAKLDWTMKNRRATAAFLAHIRRRSLTLKCASARSMPCLRNGPANKSLRSAASTAMRVTGFYDEECRPFELWVVSGIAFSDVQKSMTCFRREF